MAFMCFGDLGNHDSHLATKSGTRFGAVFPTSSDAAACDYLSPCRCSVDLQKFNPIYPRSLLWLLYHKDTICGHGNHGKL